MIERYLIPSVIFILAVIIQLTFIPLISIHHISPDLILILLVYFTLKYGQLYGTVMGFVFGFFFDLFSGGLLGASMFSKTLAGFLAGYFYGENKIEYNLGSFMFILIVLICAAVDSYFYSVLGVPEISFNIVSLFVEQGLLSGVYTALLSLPVIVLKPRKLIK